ncbi:MAG: hypothetical protein IPL89_15135 [Acidobacteria bacterium]|nr:hypothetical protein [Acidobacteriota bacterium]
MENLHSPTTADQAPKNPNDTQAGNLSGRAREIADAARRNLGQAAGKVSDYADDNTAMVAIAAFGVGLLVGHLVTRES